ncbi:acyl-CoA dehydrogenase family protein [Pseudonocardia xishanensis]|uniref:acyl-CoA dehydrogenase family protein n=1 Tax=Pseudonocardia xishanensis TaxID=630995 RepID=UPI0031E6172D
MTFSTEQRDLQQVLRDVLAREDDAQLWKRLTAELGLAGISVPEEVGGAGGSTIELGIVVGELGRVLAPVPFLQTMVAGTVLARSAAGRDTGLLPDLADGRLVGGLASPGTTPPVAARTDEGLRIDGVLDHVVDGPRLDVVLTPVTVDGTAVLAAVRRDADRAETTTLPTLDQSRPLARIALHGAQATEVGDAADVARAHDLLLAAVAVESAAAARSCLDMTVEHLKVRVQFGAPIGSFQALQHRCADLAVLVEAATSTAWYALWAVGSDDEPRGGSVTAPLAKVYAAQAFRRVAGEMIQLHGGIGFTWEHPAHRYFKRATSTGLLFGGRSWARGLVSERAGLGLWATGPRDRSSDRASSR